MSRWRGLSLVCPRCGGELSARPSGAVCLRCDAEYAEHEGVLELVAGRRGTPGFDPHFFSTLRAVEDRHFWFVGRRQVVLSALRRAVPDLDRAPRGNARIRAGGASLAEAIPA